MSFFSSVFANPTVALFIMMWYYSSTVGSLPRVVTMSDDTEVAVLRARLKAIVKKVEDTEAQAARLLVEKSKAAALEQTATTVCQRVPSSSSPAAASRLISTASLTYEDTVVVRLHLQAVAVLNVRQLVNIVLDSSTNYAS
jgi:hypothetical protein